MAVVADGTGVVPVTGYQVVLAPAGHRVTLTHPRTGPVVVAAEGQVALWCAGTEMLTTITVRVHDSDPTRPDGPDAPADVRTGSSVAGPRPEDRGLVEEVEWVVRDGGRLLAYADDYGATPVDGVEVGPRRWRLRVTVRNRAAAADLDEQLVAADEAAWADTPETADADPAQGPVPGPVLGPEVWLLDLWPLA